MRPLVEVDQLVVDHGTVRAVAGASWSAARGSVCALLGPNGAGKSSTMDALAGFRKPTAGTVTVAGADPFTEHARVVPKLGVMLQHAGTYPGARTADVIALFCAHFGHRKSAEELLSLVGLTEQRRRTWRQLSGGEQQRLSLALALAGKPEVLLLDEPTASVDVAGRQLIRSIIRHAADDGCCVVLTTHELDEAERLADHVVIMDRGAVVAAGAPAELRRAAPADSFRFATSSAFDVDELSRSLGVSVVRDSPGEFLVGSPSSPQLIANLTAWMAAREIALDDLRAGRQRLEDVYLALTQETSSAAIARTAGRRRRKEAS